MARTGNQERKGLYQFMIQIGNHPNISFFMASHPMFSSGDAAKTAARHELHKRGYDDGSISDKWIHVRHHSPSNGLEDRAAPLSAGRIPYSMMDWTHNQDGSPRRRVYDEEVIRLNGGY